ncbi:hypothetical protein [Williamsia sp. CHRR-6]|uniref:hypothetical protein n=1 Tax=Williamsia sp. CHRR-6 TaxID=2835871 RepID=UPI001BD9D922|nr:hypothetical protein [Williamsia sp. CHRR-6]MBT0566873.1 hypothetical protein [Williamsia sp. CHRR-6]
MGTDRDTVVTVDPSVSTAPVLLEERVSGAGESFLLVDETMGVHIPMNTAWVFETDPGVDAIGRVHQRLVASSLSLRAVSPRVPAARSRWQRCADCAPLFIDPVPVAPGGVSQWLDAHVREHRLAPRDGRAWQLATAGTTDGGRVVSLLVSHAVADGRRMIDEVGRAMTGLTSDRLVPEPVAPGVGEIVADLRDAAAQLGAAARVIGGAARAVLARRSRREPDVTGPAVNSAAGKSAGLNGAGRQQIPARPVAAPAVSPHPPAEPVTTVLDIDAQRWAACATSNGGSSNALLCAFAGGVAQRIGAPSPSGQTSIVISVDGRTQADRRANVAGGVQIRVPGRLGPGADLQLVRSLTKQALIAAAARPDVDGADPMQLVARLLPRPVLRRLMSAIPGPMVTTSNLGAVPPELMTLAGHRARSVCIRAASQGTTVQARRRAGTGVSVWLTTHPERVTLAVTVQHPDCIGSTGELRELLTAEVRDWGLTPEFW